MENKGTQKLWVKGDLNGYFGLFSNVLTNFLAAVGLLVTIGMPNDMISKIVIPGTAVAVGLGGIILAAQAKMLSNKTGNNEITAMPYGLSVPHYFAVAFSVIAVVYATTKDWTVALATGMAWNLIQGIIMTLGAFIGPYIRKYIPRTAMLGALAGLAITYIAMNPFGEIFTTPYIGLTSFAICLAGWFAHKKLPFNIPAGALAMMIGTILAWATGYMDQGGVAAALANVGVALPKGMIGLFAVGFAQMGPFLAACIPLAIYDFLESLDNLESAAASGEHYNVPQAMLVPGLLTILGACLGSPFPTIIYIGHPGWKATGARIGYSWLTGISVLILGFSGLLNLVLNIIPLVSLLPILVYIGMVITAQACETTEKKYFPAIAASFLPLIAGFLKLKVTSAISATGGVLDYQALALNGVPLAGWETLSYGDILIGMLIGAMVYYIIDKKFLRSASYACIAAALSFVGIIHCASIGIGNGLHISIGYLCFALVMVFMHFYKPEKEESKE
ncbi:MAG: hypothetical protein ACI4U3_01580 [Traorella sp.]